MRTPDISIIVPIYNSENYLAQTIESILNQSIDNIEILLVNDGSTDSSLEICNEYANKDNRIRVFDKENAGQGEARNYGMKYAKGRYYMFIDADDLYEKDSCESMLREIEKYKADFVTGNYQIIDNNGVKWSTPAFDVEKYQEMILDPYDHEKSFWVMNNTVWNKIYRAEFLKKNNITFKVPTPTEDVYFALMCYIKAQKRVYLPKVIYLYRNTPNSTSKNCSMKYFQKYNRSSKALYEGMKEADGVGFYRYVHAKLNAYILCQIIDSEKVTNKDKKQLVKDFKWYFELSTKLKADVIHDSLKDLYSYIVDEKYEKAIKEMIRLKEYRESIPIEKRKRMSYPTLADYKKMEKYDEEFKKGA